MTVVLTHRDCTGIALHMWVLIAFHTPLYMLAWCVDTAMTGRPVSCDAGERC